MNTPAASSGTTCSGGRESLCGFRLLLLLLAERLYEKQQRLDRADEIEVHKNGSGMSQDLSALLSCLLAAPRGRTRV